MFPTFTKQEAKCRSSLETALRLVQQAVEADKARNYEEALSLYQHALVYFLESLNCEFCCFSRTMAFDVLERFVQLTIELSLQVLFCRGSLPL